MINDLAAFPHSLISVESLSYHLGLWRVDFTYPQAPRRGLPNDGERRLWGNPRGIEMQGLKLVTKLTPGVSSFPDAAREPEQLDA